MMSTRVIQISRRLNAPPEHVYALWTEPDSIRQWFGGLETEVRAILMDLRPGGRYSIQVQTETGPATISGEFLEVDPPQRLMYTWQLENDQGTSPNTTVEVQFLPHDDQTEILLSHGPFLDDDLKILHSDGWQACFNGLEALLAA
jgi:uncharacterized protein YndB with AHSA1/START domain